MSALPAEPAPDPRDPQVILEQLSDREERQTFLRQYREAAEAAREPAGWAELNRVLRLWAGHVTMMQQPGYQEAREHARGLVDGGMFLDDYIRMHRSA